MQNVIDKSNLGWLKRKIINFGYKLKGDEAVSSLNKAMSAEEPKDTGNGLYKGNKWVNMARSIAGNKYYKKAIEKPGVRNLILAKALNDQSLRNTAADRIVGNHWYSDIAKRFINWLANTDFGQRKMQDWVMDNMLNLPIVNGTKNLAKDILRNGGTL